MAANNYQQAEAEARAIMEEDGSSGDEVADTLRRQRQAGQQQQQQSSGMDEDDIMDDVEPEGDAFDSDSMSSSRALSFCIPTPIA